MHLFFLSRALIFTSHDQDRLLPAPAAASQPRLIPGLLAHVHAPLVERWAGVLRIRRYVQGHTPDDAAFASLAASRGGVQAYDGVAELWIDDDAGNGAAPHEEAPRAARELLEDERKFIDLSRSTIFHVREHEILPASRHCK